MTTTTSTSSTTTSTTSGSSILTTLGVGSGVDTSSLITNLVAASRSAKDTALSSQLSKVQAQVSGISTLKSAVTTFSTSLQALVGGGTLQTQPESSNTAAVQVSTVTGTSMGAADSAITVTQLASAQSIASPGVASADTPIGTGSLTFTFGDATMSGTGMTGFAAKTVPAAITLTIDSSNDTLSGIAAAINNKNAGLTATVVTDTSGARLVVKGATGADAAFTISASEDAGSPGLSALAFGPGTSNSTVNQVAQNAVLSYDGLSVSRSSNTISDLIPGVQLSLKATGSTTISANRPTSAISEAVTDFVNAYNSLLATIDEQTDKDTGSLNGDSSVRQMTTLLGKLTSTALTASGRPSTLAEIGVSTSTDGTLTVNTSKLSTALSTYPDQVEAMFNPTQSSSSALVRIVSLVDAAPAGTHTLTNVVPATAGTLTGTANPSAFASPLVLDSSNNTFQVALDGGTAAMVTVPEGSYADGASFAAALQSAIQANAAITVNASVSWDAATGTLSAASKTFSSTSAISIVASDGGVGDAVGLTGATTARGTNASGTIDGKPAVAVGSMLFADSNGTAAGLVVQPLAGASDTTITLGLGLSNALADIVTSLTNSTSGALYTANTRLTSQETAIEAQQTKVNDDSNALKTRLTQQFAAMDSKVAAYKSTQSFLTQQIDAWNKSDSN